MAGRIPAACLPVGTLQPLLAKFPLQEIWFRAYVPRRSHKLARVQALVDWLASHLEGFMVAQG